MSSATTFLSLPPEIRIKICGLLFYDLISKLLENLYAMFTVFHNEYDTTRDPKRRWNPSFLVVIRTIYTEAISVLYVHAEIVVDLRNGLDYIEMHAGQEYGPRYPYFKGVHLTPLRLATRLKLNIYLDGLEYGASDEMVHLASLEIHIEGGCSDDATLFCEVMETLKARLLSRPSKAFAKLLYPW